MRVVTGEAKGRKLKGPKTIGTRPIIDRVKQALFNILASRVEDARFLDLFAGTGSVGIEALSRGAARATFIELDRDMLAVVRENLRITGLDDRAETLHTDAFKFLQNELPDTIHGQHGQRSQQRQYNKRSKTTPVETHKLPRSNAPYDIIYVAPPQYQEMAARALGILDTSPLLVQTGLVIIQIHPKERDGVVAMPLTRLALTDERRYGSTLLLFYATNEEQSTNVDTTTET
jgi:16S rRNA (guanine966-N2)-methyltransferase